MLLLKRAVLFTLFSEVFAVSLGILLTAVTLGFFPLDTGMAGFFLPPRQYSATDALFCFAKEDTEIWQLGLNNRIELRAFVLARCELASFI